MQTSDAAPGWFRLHFGDDYRVIYQGRDQGQADLEAGAIIRELEIGPGDRVLDLCCGHGRHLKAFAKHGIGALGVDLSRTLLRCAEKACGGKIVCADMRALPFPGGADGFSVVVNFFTSFGYFSSDEENLGAARELARVLRPGGRFCLDLMNADSTIRSLVPLTERNAGPFRVIESRSHDALRRRIEKQIELHDTRTGTIQCYHESVRAFSPEEIESLLHLAGLRVERWLGDFHGAAYSPTSERMIVLGRTRA